jgi:DNA uptake protein ComE-like DNA-binding protein
MNVGTNLLALGLVTAALVFAVRALRPPGTLGRAGPLPPSSAAWDRPIEINHATVEEWEALDGIGPKLAAKIVAARPFARIDDLAHVRGVGRRRLARLRPRLFLDEGAGDHVR